MFVESSERHNIMFKDGVPEQMKEIAQAPMDRAARMVSQWTPPLWSKESAGPPKALLLRATESFDPKIERSPKLGWESYPHDFIALVVPIPGNHFTIFELDNVSCFLMRHRVEGPLTFQYRSPVCLESFVRGAIRSRRYIGKRLRVLEVLVLDDSSTELFLFDESLLD